MRNPAFAYKVKHWRKRGHPRPAEAFRGSTVRLFAPPTTMKQSVSKHALDEIDWKILAELQQNARTPFAELGRRVGLSTPAVTERVRKLEEEGIIVGFRTQIDHAKVGLPLLAFIRVKVDGENLSHFTHLASSFTEVIECHRITGAESFLVKAAVADIGHLETLLDALMPYEATTTSMVLSTALAWGNIAKPGSPPRNIPQVKRRKRS